VTVKPINASSSKRVSSPVSSGGIAYILV
jgi:hypothetical protein